MEIKIKNITILNPDGNQRTADVMIQDKFISEIKEKIGTEADIEIDGTGKILIPGLVDMHNHIAMTNIRGLLDNLKFDDFLKKSSFLDSKRTDDEIYWGAKLGILELLSNGVTAFADMYYSENIIAEAVKEIGIRSFLGWAIVNKEITTQKGDPVKNAEDFINRYKDDELINPHPAPHGVYSTTREDLLAAKDLADRYEKPLSMHLSETKREVYDLVKKEKKRPVEYLDDLGILSERFVGAHGVYLTLSEIKRLGKYGVTIVNNPLSNMKLGHGNFAPIIEMLEYGVNLTLGTDSATTSNTFDMLEVARIASYLQFNYREEPLSLAALDVFKFMTINPYKVFKLNLGLIKENYIADLAIIKRDINLLPSGSSPVDTLIYSGNSRNVEFTIVNGKLLYEKGNFPGIDTEQIVKKNDEIFEHYKSLINS